MKYFTTLFLLCFAGAAHAVNPSGSYDRVDHNTCVITGWAFDRDAPKAKVIIQAFREDGVLLLSVHANTFRQDVGNYLLSTFGAAVVGGPSERNYHGFAHQLPSFMRDGLYHRTYIYAINIGQGTNTYLGAKGTLCARP